MTEPFIILDTCLTLRGHEAGLFLAYRYLFPSRAAALVSRVSRLHRSRARALLSLNGETARSLKGTARTLNKQGYSHVNMLTVLNFSTA